jgi:predicted transcriptional regulator of viral defense system
MTYHSTRQARRLLLELAGSQGGYFTAKQAGAVGYGRQHVEYHVAVGNFERIGHGLYRLPGVALAEHAELIRLSLWSRGRDDRPQAVVSHETALALHGLGDCPEGVVHLTVPRSFRKAAPAGASHRRTTMTSRATPSFASTRDEQWEVRGKARRSGSTPPAEADVPVARRPPAQESSDTSAPYGRAG